MCLKDQNYNTSPFYHIIEMNLDALVVKSFLNMIFVLNYIITEGKRK